VAVGDNDLALARWAIGLKSTERGEPTGFMRCGRVSVVRIGHGPRRHVQQLCTDLPWSQRLTEVWRMTDPHERDASLALRSAHGHRLRTAVKWYRTQGRLHTGDPIAMAADALNAYLHDRARHKDALLVCDTWEMANALNRRLHDTLTKGPSVTAARDQRIRVGDLVISRANDPTIAVHPGPTNTA